MGALRILRRFIDSNSVLEKAAREVTERLPLSIRYGISYGPIFRQWLGFLKVSEEWDGNRMEEYQVEQTKGLLLHAARNVPYYRKLFAEYGYNPSLFQSLRDLQFLPYLDKESVRDKIDDLIASNIPRHLLFRKETSGSTGIPLAIYSDKAAEERHWASVVYAWGKKGYHPKSRIVTFWGIRQKWKRYANQLILSRYHFGREALFEFYSLMRNFRPLYVMGLPSVLYLFAGFMKEHGLRPFEDVKSCIVESEHLYPWQKELIEETLGAPVHSTYGLVEKVVYGLCCNESSSYHTLRQYGFAEDAGIHTGLSEIVGTGFINYAMPLLRYRTADLGKITEGCRACGGSHSSLELVEGRMGELIVDRDGGLQSPMRLGVNSDVFNHVKIFQLFQDAPGEVTLRLVRRDSFTNDDYRRIQDKVVEDLGFEGREDRMKISIVFVDDIERGPSGKFRMVDQKLDMRKFLNRQDHERR